MIHPNNFFIDFAKPVLDSANELNDDHREALWDAFHQSPDVGTLIGHLAPLTHVSDETKQALVGAKQKQLAPPADASNLDVAIHALRRLAELPPETLDAAEEHPTVARQIVNAALGADTKKQ
jgi:hypothetical protein